jgi:hypothetical protein
MAQSVGTWRPVARPSPDLAPKGSASVGRLPAAMRPQSMHDFSGLSIYPPRRRPVAARRATTIRVESSAERDRGARWDERLPRRRDFSVVPVEGNEQGDVTADAGPGPSPPAVPTPPVPTPAQPTSTPATTSCDCCVDDVAISNVNRIDNATHMGHSFDVNIALQYPASLTSGPGGLRPCTLEWWEKTNVPAIPGHAPNTWTDMYALLPTSPTFAPWNNRGGRCETSQGVTITDPPSLGKRPGRTVTRKLEFDIKVFSARGAGCTNASRNATATQVLKMVSGAADWSGSSFTTP